MTPLFVIESGSVSGALVSISKKDKPKILFSYSEDLPFSESVTEERLRIATVSALKNVLQAMTSSDAFLEKGVLFEVPQIVIGAPWYTSFSRIINQVYKRPEFFKEETLNEMMRAEVKRFEDEHNLGQDNIVLEKKITNVLLNGYTTSSPFGKKTMAVEVSFYTSIILASLKKEIEDAIVSHIHFKQAVWHSAPIILFGALRTLLKDTDFLILEIGSELSELSLVKNSHLLNTVSMPIGARKITRKIADTLQISEQIVSSLLNDMESASVEKINSTKNVVLGDWQPIFHEAISTLSGGYSIPSKFFVMSSLGTESLAKDLITSDAYANQIVAGSSFGVVTFDTLKSQVSLAENSVPASIFIILSTLFISSFEQSVN